MENTMNKSEDTDLGKSSIYVTRDGDKGALKNDGDGESEGVCGTVLLFSDSGRKTLSVYCVELRSVEDCSSEAVVTDAVCAQDKIASFATSLESKFLEEKDFIYKYILMILMICKYQLLQFYKDLKYHILLNIGIFSQWRCTFDIGHCSEKEKIM